ncbi:MAG TPA: hypothetical protein VMQ81_07225 [Acidimicrobiia bacterium]|nr:hypothetical protein [Acidimicrobiia bacterium]
MFQLPVVCPPDLTEAVVARLREDIGVATARFGSLRRRVEG